ncbi:uncharacterized protein LOC131382416 isoform X2 [Hylobates moloch]|nr:uncharacterized protein LOC131382416 isoform X2 [Hylobates moloch]XP_058290292.1 uncharacterized protein LOC131382416 isoform X2 [Hylobates moloch]
MGSPFPQTDCLEESRRPNPKWVAPSHSWLWTQLGTDSPASMLPIIPGLKVGFTRSLPLYAQESVSFLPPSIISSTVPRLLELRVAWRPVLRHPQPPTGLPPVLISAQSPEGAEAEGGWCVSTTLRAHTPSQVATAPGLGLNFGNWSRRWERGETRQREQASFINPKLQERPDQQFQSSTV